MRQSPRYFCRKCNAMHPDQAARRGTGNRYRFHLDPELIVAWESAKQVVTGPQPKEAVATPLPPAGIEKPAA